METKLDYGLEQPDSQLAERSGIRQSCNDRSPASMYEEDAEKRGSGDTLELNEKFIF